jgi:hypothetical protein
MAGFNSFPEHQIMHGSHTHEGTPAKKHLLLEVHDAIIQFADELSQL